MIPPNQMSDSVIPEMKTSADKVRETDKVEFVVRTTNQYAEEDDPDEEIPEILPSGSIIRDFDNDRTGNDV